MAASFSRKRTPSSSCPQQSGTTRAQKLGVNAVLGVSFVVEGYSLLVATRAVLQGAQAAGLSFVQFLRRGLDPTSIAVMLEDGAAVTGLAIAGVIPNLTRQSQRSLIVDILPTSSRSLVQLTTLPKLAP